MSMEYPQWAVEAYGGINLKKWATRKKLGGILGAVGAMLFCTSLFGVIAMICLHTMQGAVIVCPVLISGATLALTGLWMMLSVANPERKMLFEQDLMDLQEMLGYTLMCRKSIYSHEDVARDVRNVLNGDAVWIRIYELAKDEKLAKARRREMRDHYNLCVRFQLLPPTPEAYSLSHLNIKPFFDAADAKASAILRLALAQLDLTAMAEIL